MTTFSNVCVLTTLIWFITPLLSVNHCECENPFKRDFDTVLYVAGTNSPAGATPPVELEDGFGCWNKEAFDSRQYSGSRSCKVADIIHCGKGAGVPPTTAKVEDFITFCNGVTMRFNGVVSLTENVEGADGFDQWQFVFASFATKNNLVSSSIDCKGSRSVRGFSSFIDEMFTLNYDEYYFLSLECSDDDDDDDDSDSNELSELVMGLKDYIFGDSGDTNHEDKEQDVIIDLNTSAVIGLWSVVVLLIAFVGFCCYYRCKQ
eukprot:26377_1